MLVAANGKQTFSGRVWLALKKGKFWGKDFVKEMKIFIAEFALDELRMLNG